MLIKVATLLLGTLLSALAQAERVGEVDTVFKFFGPDHKIVVDAYDDPKVAGITCFVSRAKTGGIKGAIGLAEDDVGRAAFACVVGAYDQVGEAIAVHVARAVE